MSSDAVLVVSLLAIFFAVVSVLSYYLIPRFNNAVVAMIGGVLIPYITIVIILVMLMNTSLLKKVQNKGWSSILVFFKECFWDYYLRSGLFVTTLAILVIWLYRKKKNCTVRR
jgi:chromate transport protein ChrA